MTDLNLAAMVKPLEWEMVRPYIMSAGEYSIWCFDSGAVLTRSYIEIAEKLKISELQNAAQADYAARIAAALDPAAVDALVRAAEQRGREAGLREAAQAVANDAGEFDHPATHYTFGRLAEKILALITKEAAP